MQAGVLPLLASIIMVINIVGLFVGIIAESLLNDSLFSQLPLLTSFSTTRPAVGFGPGH